MNWMQREDRHAVASKRARQMLISVFAILALALGMFVMASMSGQHAVASSTHSESSTHNLPASSIGSAQSVTVGAVVSVITNAEDGSSFRCDATCELGCAFVGAACVLAVVAFGVALFFISRGLAFLDVAARPRGVWRAWGAQSVVMRPSLVALSISRT